MGLGNRVKILRKQLDLTQSKFGARIGMKQNSIALIESETRNISKQAILAICREFNVNETWLRTGEGEMFISRPDTILNALAAEYGLTGSDRVLIEKFLELDKKSKEDVIDYIRRVADALNELDDVPKNFDEMTIDEKVELYRQELEREGEKYRA